MTGFFNDQWIWFSGATSGISNVLVCQLAERGAQPNLRPHRIEVLEGLRRCLTHLTLMAPSNSEKVV